MNLNLHIYNAALPSKLLPGSTSNVINIANVEVQIRAFTIYHLTQNMLVYKQELIKGVVIVTQTIQHFSFDFSKCSDGFNSNLYQASYLLWQ